MKKALLLIIILSILSPLFSESGKWIFEPLFTRLPDGTLISAGMEYSDSFSGFEEIYFIDDYLARMIIRGEEFRAFYDFIPGDAGNRKLILTFRDGRSLDVQTAPIYGEQPELGRSGWIFYYILPEGFFDPPDSEDSVNEEDAVAEREQETGTEDSLGKNPVPDVIPEEVQEPVIWSITGYLREYP